MKKLGVAGWALAAFALTASSASAEIITLRCTLNWHSLGTVEVLGVVLDTELRAVRFDGRPHTVEGSATGDLIARKVGRFDNERIVFGDYDVRGNAVYVYSIDRITGSISYISTTSDGSRRGATGSCERGQAAF